MGHLNVITLTINLIQRNLQNKSSYLSVIKQACKSNKKYLKTIVLQREVVKKSEKHIVSQNKQRVKTELDEPLSPNLSRYAGTIKIDLTGNICTYTDFGNLVTINLNEKSGMDVTIFTNLG